MSIALRFLWSVRWFLNAGTRAVLLPSSVCEDVSISAPDGSFGFSCDVWYKPCFSFSIFYILLQCKAWRSPSCVTSDLITTRAFISAQTARRELGALWAPLGMAPWCVSEVCRFFLLWSLRDSMRGLGAPVCPPLAAAASVSNPRI